MAFSPHAHVPRQPLQIRMHAHTRHPFAISISCAVVFSCRASGSTPFSKPRSKTAALNLLNFDSVGLMPRLNHRLQLDGAMLPARRQASAALTPVRRIRYSSSATSLSGFAMSVPWLLVDGLHYCTCLTVTQVQINF